jgi:hypothetical protein
MYNTFSIQNDLQQGHPLCELLFSFTADYTIMNVQESQERWELNGTQLLVCTEGVNLLDRNINTRKKNTKGSILYY